MICWLGIAKTRLQRLYCVTSIQFDHIINLGFDILGYVSQNASLTSKSMNSLTWKYLTLKVSNSNGRLCAFDVSDT